jgi:predicted naringenin-chalcone synthase
LAVVSCTGYTTPGIDVCLARDLTMHPSTERVILGHLGCHGALPGLRVVADFVSETDRPALLCCVELSSLHVQPAGEGLSQVVVHSLFGDAAVAVALTPSPRSQLADLELLDLAARSDLQASDMMSWEITDRGFAMRLDRRLPEVVGAAVAPLVDDLLARHRLARRDIAGWAVHPGGPRVLEVVAERLGLADGALDSSWRVLARRGNCSSATILLVLQELVASDPPQPGEYVMALTFGPGMTLYAGLLRAT